MDKRPNIRPGITFQVYVMLQECGHSVPSLGQESIIDYRRTAKMQRTGVVILKTK